MNDAKEKKHYSQPMVREYGTLEEITKQTNKELGGSDGMTFQQQPIHWS